MSMTENDYKHFVCIVASNNPKELMDEYSKNKDIEPRLIYRYSDIPKIKKAYINEYEKALKEAIRTKSEYVKAIEGIIEDLKEISDDDYYDELLNNNPYFYPNEENGDIMTKKNIDGKFSHYQLGKNFSIPFITNDNKEVFQCLKKDINWNIVHLSGGYAYERVWEMVMENSKPINQDEKVLYDNMFDKVEYFKKFETKENYVISNTAFWGYAFLSDTTGWIEITDNEDQFEWMKNFYNVFIKNLKDDTLLTIYECIK